MPLICRVDARAAFGGRPDLGAKKDEMADCLQGRGRFNAEALVGPLLLLRFEGLATFTDSVLADASSMT